MPNWLLILGSSKATQTQIIETSKKTTTKKTNMHIFVSTLKDHTLAQI
jgi:hypothetical protein